MIILFDKPVQKIVRLCFSDSFVDEINQHSDAAVIKRALTKKDTNFFRVISDNKYKTNNWISFGDRIGLGKKTKFELGLI